MTKRPILAVMLAASLASAQQNQRTDPPSQPAKPSAQQPGESGFPPDTPAPPPKQSQTPSTPARSSTSKKAPDRAAAYYHYSMAHIYEELVAIYGRSEFANKAIEEYKLAIENDPTSEFLNAGLAELYAKTGRIRDAVLEAQEILKRDPNNLDARKLLGRIYLRSLGDLQQGSQSQQLLKLAIEQYEQIIKLEPNSIENHLLLGRLYRINNELPKAEAQFKKAVSLQPESEEAVTTLAYLYNEEGDSKRAAEILSQVPESGRSAKHYVALGYTYEQLKDNKKSIEAYRRAVEMDKDNLDAMRGLAQSLMSDGQHEAALEQYKAVVEADPRDVQSHMRMAEIYRRTGRFDQALDSLKRAEAEVQDSVEVPYNMAVIYQAQGRYNDASQLLQKLIERSQKPEGSYTAGERNNRAVFLERLGTIYREAGKPQQAIESFRKMLELGDENAARGYHQIIETHRDSKQWSQATAAAREGSERVPNDRSLKLVYLSQLADIGKADEALAQTKALLKGSREDREIYLALAQMYSRQKRWKEAEESVAQAERLATKPDEKEYAVFVAGSIYERQKKYDRAEEMFRRVLSQDPNNAATLNYLGYMLADRGVRLEEALGYVKKAVDFDPQNGAYLDSLGWVYFKMGNYTMAEEYLRKAVERVSNDATIHDHLGDLYQKTGRLKLAAAHWERALEEWNKTVPAEQDQIEIARVQKKLESAKVKLAKKQTAGSSK